MKKVLLLSMPFGAMDRPALGISLLKAALTRDGIGCDVRYPAFAFADLLGAETYHWVSSGLPYVAFAGDWCFAEALYGPRPAADEAYQTEVLRGTWRLSDEDIARLWAVRELVEPFLEHCLASIPWEDYALVGFTSTFEQNLASLALARRLSARHPGLAIVFGGANWEGEMGEELHRRFEFVDYVCSGEADATFPSLAARILAGNREPASLPPGIVHRDGGDTRSTGRAEVVRDLDALPVPDFDDYFAAWEASAASLVAAPILLLETSRGCWWGEKAHCTFCGLNGATMTYRSKSAARALEELRGLSERWRTERVEVVDNILDMRYFADFLPALAADGRPWEIFYEVKANLSRAQVTALRAAGVTRIQPGIESLSDHVLALMNKGTTGLRNVQLLKWCREQGIGVDWNILYGFPGERAADYERTLELLPSIAFLDPPVACGPIRMDRFSPYFARPEAFGLSGVRPLQAYAYLYPFPQESLMRIAYHFDFDHGSGQAHAGYADEVIRFAETWRRDGPRGSLAQRRRADGSLALRDTRPDAAHASHELSGMEAEVYAFCDELHSTAAIVRHLDALWPGRGVDEAGLRPFLDSLVDNRLMVGDGKHWLSLAVRERADLPAELCRA
jgi:ribosomal peptide maturation radical SAM protein 1